MLAAGRARVLPDPREGITRLDDRTPILMLPVRLETRFRAHELLVRIYPDDCFLDTFEEELTDSELANGHTYWLQMWQAAGSAPAERGAWRGLVDAHGSGRAGWIASVTAPSNPSDKPLPGTFALTIAMASPPSASERAALTAYWTTRSEAAWADVVALGLTEIRPSNVDAPAPQGADITVAFLVFPSVATKATAWSRAPRVRSLPQRFVFVGYREGHETVVVGEPVPPLLQAGPDPQATGDQQFQRDADGNLVIPPEVAWIADFDQAVAVGMGIRVPLPSSGRQGFDRVLVLGVRMSSDPGTGQDELTQLLTRHTRSRTGLALVPQGTPTNNTEGTGSGLGRVEDADDSFPGAPLYTTSTDWTSKSDGQWLAEYLGLPAEFFAHTAGADAGDQMTARAMNTALWPATLGYWMHSMMGPVFSDGVEQQTRHFFQRYVLGAGAVPAMRIGKQPYGILPATAFSRMDWLSGREHGGAGRTAYLRELYHLLRAVQQDWAALVPGVSHVGGPGDPHQILLDVIGQHSGSVEWSQRYAESIQVLLRRLKLLGVGDPGLFGRFAAAIQLLERHGYTGENPDMLNKIFSGQHHLLTGGVVDDRKLSEVDPVRDYTDDGRNYLEWLATASRAGLTHLYQQEGFTGGKPPRALLYLLLRHALQLGHAESAIRLHEDAGLFSPAQAALARVDKPFLHLETGTQVSESRYQPLFAVQPAITGSPVMTVADYLAANLLVLPINFDLIAQHAALDRLSQRPTAQLERAFADHIDTCSYRLDAWLLGLVQYQLTLMRGLHNDEPAQPGIYLGAYAWLEDLHPRQRAVEPVRLTDPELAKDFAGRTPLTRDSSNQGYIHAPSLNHAVAAAVLRNGYLSAQTKEHRDALAVNLTSERVRIALATIEGIRAGQGLGDLLGYQFERGLHDKHTMAEVDGFIYELRKAFPLRANRMASTRSPAFIHIRRIEARNVIDGLALAEHMKRTGSLEYPFGLTGLPDASQAQKDVLSAEAKRLLDIHDAVADLALAEGVYQAVLGNYDRVASTYDAYAHGNFPPEPDIIRTPQSGMGLTSRVALHLPSVAAAPAGATPRAVAEPAVNAWLASILPPLGQVGCTVTFTQAATGTEVTREVTLDQLALQPIDLINLIRDDADQAMSEVDDRILRHTLATFGARLSGPFQIGYMQTLAAPVSVFELMPVIRAARKLITTSRPLAPTDLALTAEATGAQDEQIWAFPARLDPVKTALEDLRDDLTSFAATLGAAPLSAVDSTVDQLATLLARTGTFGLPQSGWGVFYAGLRDGFHDLQRLCADLATRWDEQLIAYGDLLTQQAIAGTSDEERFRLLTDAERLISALPMNPRPATPDAFLLALETVTRPAFQARLAQFAAIATTTRSTVSALHADVQALLPIDAFDVVPFAIGPVEEPLSQLLRDAHSLVTSLLAEISRRLTEAAKQLTAYAATTVPKEKVAAVQAAAKALLGPEFLIVPDFAVDAGLVTSMTAAISESQTGALFSYLTTPPDPTVAPLDFPADTWLHGVARVREKLHAWEQLTLFTDTLGASSLDLQPIQLPFVAGEKWLGLRFPPEQELDSERLLYTFSGTFDATVPQRGLLLDEWSEFIPGDTTETGLTFHFDRPNHEAPQAMLLVTPSSFRGQWQWADLVDALNETLNLAKLRAIEPSDLDKTAYAMFLPATVMATQARQLTIAANLALNNKLYFVQDGQG